MERDIFLDEPDELSDSLFDLLQRSKLVDFVMVVRELDDYDIEMLDPIVNALLDKKLLLDKAL